MDKRYRILHKTTYNYSEPVFDSFNSLKLYPNNCESQSVELCVISVTPSCNLRHYYDFFNNKTQYFNIFNNHYGLTITSDTIVSVNEREKFPYGSSLNNSKTNNLIEKFRDYIVSSKHVVITPEIWRTAIDIREDTDDIYQIAYKIMSYIFQTFDYDKEATDVRTNSDKAFILKKGVCQDYAHVMTSICRSLKIPARYVSGYIYESDQNILIGTGATHAWVEIYIPSKNCWYGLDPTNNVIVDGNYIKIAHGRDYNDVAPITGTIKGGGKKRSLEVDVKIERIN